MKKILLSLLLIVAVLTVVYYAGPKVEYEAVSADMPTLNVALEELDAYIDSNERMVPGVKLDNQSRIVWADDSVQQTEYAIVYLHGFSASPMESRPVHLNLAKKFGMNLYLPRLSQHGLEDTDAFLDLTPSSLMESAKEALAIGQIIGKKVILMSCSTGGTLSIYLAANHPEKVFAQLLYSPNIEIFDGTVKIVNDPWGEKILKSIVGDFRDHPEDRGTEIERYWTIKYRSEGVIALQDLLEQTMTNDVFQGVSQPYMLGFYYKNEEEQDNVVSVAAMRDFDLKTSTPNDKKQVSEFPSAGGHVIASDLQSKDWQAVQVETQKYITEILGIPAVD